MDAQINKNEIKILDHMYLGDKKRDASDKIRGFLFQDIVFVEKIMNDNVLSVSSEYLEDIDIFYNDNTYEIIQIKYYSKSQVKINDIYSDLYYQFLRLNILKSNLKVKTKLIVHTNKKISEFSVEKLCNEFDIKNDEDNNTNFDKFEYLEKNVYPKKKAEQEKELFKTFASVKTAQAFFDNFSIEEKEDIETFQAQVKDLLYDKYKKYYTDQSIDSDKLKNVLFGLSIIYVHRRYKMDNVSFNEVSFKKEDFEEYIKNNISLIDKNYENYISSYLVSIVYSTIEEIYEYNEDLSIDQLDRLKKIYCNTVEWIKNLSSTIDGQYQLVNTLSFKNKEEIKGFKTKNPLERLLIIAECNIFMNQFLKYLWKIMYNISEGKSRKIKCVDENLNPETYLDKTINEYICFKFPDDCVDTSAILTLGNPGSPKRSLKNLSSRMIKYKPRKWYLKSNYSGKYDYSYKTCERIEDNSITNISDDSFIIECMDCIKVDDDQWANTEDCKDCIFNMKCKKGNI